MIAAPELAFEWSVAGRTADNEKASGDQCLVQAFDNGVLLAVIDGLGHGDKAAEVAETTRQVLAEFAHEPPEALFQRCHRRLVGTRGVVMSLVSVSLPAATLTWLGVGNVESLLLRANPAVRPERESLLLRGGIVGYRLPNLRPVTLSLARGDLLLMATDGLRSSFGQDPNPQLLTQQIADDLLARYVRGTDDALVLVARYLGTT